MRNGLPVWSELRADPGWRCIDLISDLHLQADRPLTFEAWRRFLMHTPADAVLMLGDVFDAWVGDDSRHAGFEADCQQVLREASKQRFLGFMAGNRDFLVGDAMLADSAVHRLADPTLLLAFDRRWLLSHGDALCLADTDYQRFRQQVRDPSWQRQFLALPLDERRRRAQEMRDASIAHQAALAPGHWSDVDDPAACDWLRSADAAVLVHGHTHRPALHAMAPGLQRHVLGDWEFDPSPQRARILRMSAGGLQPLDLAQ